MLRWRERSLSLFIVGNWMSLEFFFFFRMFFFFFDRFPFDRDFIAIEWHATRFVCLFFFLFICLFIWSKLEDWIDRGMLILWECVLLLGTFFRCFLAAFANIFWNVFLRFVNFHEISERKFFKQASFRDIYLKYYTGGKCTLVSRISTFLTF